jgi:hypothetical protein
VVGIAVGRVVGIAVGNAVGNVDGRVLGIPVGLVVEAASGLAGGTLVVPGCAGDVVAPLGAAGSVDGGALG